MGKFILTILFSVAISSVIAAPSIAAMPICEEAYFAPDDHGHERPLQKPHQELVKSYKLAKAGNAMEQRNLAVSYDAGYLVNACPEKAYYWYQKAAQNGDQVAQDWLDRYNKFKEMHDGREFVTVSKSKLPQAPAKEASQSIATPPADAASPLGVISPLGAISSSDASPNADNGASYKCQNVLDGSDYYSSKPCPKKLGRSLVE